MIHGINQLHSYGHTAPLALPFREQLNTKNTSTIQQSVFQCVVLNETH